MKLTGLFLKNNLFYHHSAFQDKMKVAQVKDVRLNPINSDLHSGLVREWSDIANSRLTLRTILDMN